MKMNKTVLISFFALFVLAFSVSAWHCTDTDANKPAPVNGLYGTWGDNGFLNGTTQGWSVDDKTPAGCSGTQGNYNCVDHCDGTTLVEYYCGDRQPTRLWSQYCHWVGSGYNYTLICEDRYSNFTIPHTGETVIFSKLYEDLNSCVPETPEFGTIAAGVALIGAVAGVAIVRRKK